MDRASKFYETVLDVKLETIPSPTGDDMQMKTFPGDMESYGTTGALVKMEGYKAGGNSTLIHFGSDDWYYRRTTCGKSRWQNSDVNNGYWRPWIYNLIF